MSSFDLAFFTLLGGRQLEGANAVDHDARGRVVVAGYTASDDWPITECSLGQTNDCGASDAFSSQLKEAASGRFYSTYLGGIAPDAAFGLAVGAVERGNETGYTVSPNLPLIESTLESPHLGGSIGAFATRLALFELELPEEDEDPVTTSPRTSLRDVSCRR